VGRAVLAGFVYFAAVFAVGFVLGAVRVFVILPALGETAAVFIELPVILAACWAVSWIVTARWLARGEQGAALVMGAAAFVLLMAAELTLAQLAFGRSLTDQLAHWLTLAGAAGLGGQIAYALFPWIQTRLRKA